MTNKSITSLAAQQKPENQGFPFKINSWCILDDEKKIHDLVDDMLSSHRDFDFMDEITLCGLADEKAFLSKYNTIVLPYVKFIPESAAAALYRYAAKGGRGILVDDVPTVLSDKPEKLNTQCMEIFKDNPVNVMTPVAEIKGSGTENIFVSRYIEKDKDIFFLYNRSKNVFHCTCDGIQVEVQALSGLMVDDSYKIEKTQGKILDLNSDWRVEFGENQLAMSFMQVYENDEIDNADYKQGKSYDLMMREKNPASTDSLKVLYRCRLTSSGNISDAKIVMDEGAVSGNWKIYVNGNLIEDWTRKRFYDCNNICADVKLKQSTSPSVNLIDIITEGGALKEMPYLYGNFKCSYPHGHKSFPDLSAAEKAFEAGILSDWADWGYPTYSGKAVYTKTFEIEKAGVYMIDLGRAEDIAEISIDDMPSVVLPWAPYKHKVKLSEGKHDIRISVTNAPGNMFRNANLSAGLLGTVMIFTAAE